MYARLPSRREQVLPHPLVEPGAPWWTLTMTSAEPTGPWPALAALTGIMLVVLGAATALLLSGTVGAVAAAVLVAAATACGIGASRKAGNRVVSAAAPNLRGTPISGRGAELLADIVSRFDYAGRLVHEIPTGIDWQEIKPHVAVLEWSAAEHAAQYSALDREVYEMRYAEPGTPQATYRATVEARRAEHEAVVLGVQREAEDLARHAGNAAAAARMALALTGDVRSLEVVAPTGRELLAHDAIAQAKARLEMLTAVWSDLDPAYGTTRPAPTTTEPPTP